jgi:hypothetical protein
MERGPNHVLQYRQYVESDAHESNGPNVSWIDSYSSWDWDHDLL